MKLVEVVVLLGAHCISPVQSTGAVTEAAKVQCAVVVEKDTTAGTIRIVPAGASRHPEVAAVLNRMDGSVPAGATIEPANAAPGAQATVRTPLAPAVPPPAEAIAAAPPPPAAAPRPAKEEAKLAAAEAPATEEAPQEEARKAKAPAATDETAAKPASQCINGAKPKWYKNAEGRKKYRCVKAG